MSISIGLFEGKLLEKSEYEMSLSQMTSELVPWDNFGMLNPNLRSQISKSFAKRLK